MMAAASSMPICLIRTRRVYVRNTTAIVAIVRVTTTTAIGKAALDSFDVDGSIWSKGV